MKKTTLLITALTLLASAASARQICSLRIWKGDQLVNRGPVYLEWDEKKTHSDGIVRVIFEAGKESRVDVTLIDVATNAILLEASDAGPGTDARINFAYRKPNSNLRYEIRCGDYDGNYRRDIINADIDFSERR